ncbi:unnamed protein product [Somion occarium]|uniref:Pre-mRNA polyadenylation factor Fip1 domain-containing protein n=1 Tax=Somion occarium TaxID=3059160 RepID=A0ABP1CJ58_9APHY
MIYSSTASLSLWLKLRGQLRSLLLYHSRKISVEQTQALSTSNGVVANLEQKAEEEVKQEDQPADVTAPNGEGTPEDENDEEAEGEGEGEGEEEEEESEDDIEIIMEPAARSLDFRQQRPQPGRTASGQFTTPTRPQAQQPPQPSLTTEYTPRERGTLTKLPSTSQPPSTITTPAPPLSGAPGTPSQADQKPSAEAASAIPLDLGPDTSTLPVATAPPSHPSIDANVPGIFDGRSILEIDLSALAEKPWRRPGADLSDWFNYGFDELSWEAYCYRRREIGEVASVLKTNVLNFAGMPEDQLTALPPEIRTMVMAGATAMMNQAGPNGMIPPGASMNMNGSAMMSMMDMNPMMNPMMHDMGVVGMSGEMGPMGPGMPMGGPGGGPGQGMGGVMPQGPTSGMGGGVGGLSGGVGIGPGCAPQAGGAEQMGMGDGFGAPGQGGMMGMGMGGEFPMQDTNMGQQMFHQQQQQQQQLQQQPMEQRSATPTQPSAAIQSRGAAPTAPFRGRGMPPTMPSRARGGFAARGRPLPVRPSSPLPPNVPTGPRNKNKYKDIDGSAPAVEGLDYGGGGGKESRTPPDYDDRSSRKRRGSPGMDDSRSSKRR